MARARVLVGEGGTRVGLGLEDGRSCHIQTPFLGRTVLPRASWICPRDIAGTDQRSAIGMAGALPGIRGNITPNQEEISILGCLFHCSKLTLLSLCN